MRHPCNCATVHASKQAPYDSCCTHTCGPPTSKPHSHTSLTHSPHTFSPQHITTGTALHEQLSTPCFPILALRCASRRKAAGGSHPGRQSNKRTAGPPPSCQIILGLVHSSLPHLFPHPSSCKTQLYTLTYTAPKLREELSR